MNWIWIITVLLTACLLQVVFGNAMLALPLHTAAVFYFAVSTRGVAPAVVALPLAGTLDALLLHRGFPCVLSAGAALGIAAFWRRHGTCRFRIAQTAPGAVLGLSTALIHLANTALLIDPRVDGPWTHNVLYATGMLMAGAILAPILCLVLDACASRLGLPRFRDARTHSDEFDHGPLPES